MNHDASDPDPFEMQTRTIELALPRIEWQRLDRLAEALPAEEDLTPVQALLVELLDHVQQGIYRPGAWERGWLEQCVGPEAVAAAFEAEGSDL